MKYIKGLTNFILIFAIIFTPCITFASNDTIIQVKENGTPIISDDIELTKKITNINNENKEITIELNLKSKNFKTINSNTEIIFLVDDSTTMGTLLEDGATTRKVKVNNSTEKLINKISDNNPNIKMSTIYFSTDVQVAQEFTNDKNALITSVRAAKEKSPSGYTNMSTALSKAKQRFSESAENKVIVLLTDGLPTDGDENTKAQLQDNNVYIITVLVGLENENEEKIKGIFGTEQNPIADRFYNISDNDIETVISNNIYNRIISDFESSISNIDIEDYFPEEILKNFEIKIQNTSKGTSKINNDLIKWNIDTLTSSKDIKLVYTLKLKENYNPEILDKVLNTNKNVQINYITTLGNNENSVMSDSPQINITTNVNKSDSENNNNELSTNKNVTKISTTTANSSLPYTGTNSIVWVAIFITAISSILLKIRLNSLK